MHSLKDKNSRERKERIESHNPLCDLSVALWPAPFKSSTTSQKHHRLRGKLEHKHPVVKSIVVNVNLLEMMGILRAEYCPHRAIPGSSSLAYCFSLVTMR